MTKLAICPFSAKMLSVADLHFHSLMTSRKSRLPPSKHHLQASNEPPSELSSSQHIARIAKLHGNSLYTVDLPSKGELLVELPTRFRNAVWVRRGGYVVIETDGFTERKINGEIMEVVRDEKGWRKMNYWFFIPIVFWANGYFRPPAFGKRQGQEEDSIEENQDNSESSEVN